MIFDDLIFRKLVRLCGLKKMGLDLAKDVLVNSSFRYKMRSIAGFKKLEMKVNELLKGIDCFHFLPIRQLNIQSFITRYIKKSNLLF